MAKSGNSNTVIDLKNRGESKKSGKRHGISLTGKIFTFPAITAAIILPPWGELQFTSIYRVAQKVSHYQESSFKSY